MKLSIHTIIFIVLLSIGQYTTAQDNVFLGRDYWSKKTTIAQVKQDIADGNDATQLNSNSFDPTVYAFLGNTNNDVIKYLLSLEGNAINKLTHDGRTYLFWAAYTGNLPMVKYLIEHGAKTSILDDHGYNVLNFAANAGQKDTALYDYLIAQGFNPKEDKTHSGANALLLIAPSLEDDALINYFVSKGVALDSKDNDGNGIFNYAAKKGNKDFLNLLIKKGVDYKTLNDKGGNAFIFATQGTRGSANTLDFYRYLEQLGLEPNITTDDGVTPLHALARQQTDTEILDYFITKGIDVNQQDKEGYTALLYEASRGNVEQVKYFLDKGAKIQVSNKKGQTPLTLAVQYNTPEVVSYFLKNGANASVKDNDDNTLVYYLIKSYNKNRSKAFDKKLNLLKDAGVKFNQSQSANETLWHLAVKENELDLVKRMAQFNIPLNAKNKEGLTALHIAAMKASDTRILEYLLSQGADKEIKTDFEESVYDLAQENEKLNQAQTELNFLK